MTWGLVQLPSNDREFSVYATEAYYTGPDSRLRRFTYRVDGFVSVQASPGGGEFVTKPLRFTGGRLVINSVTRKEGSVRVELQDGEGHPIEGFRLGDCPALRGDAVEQTVTWKGGDDLSSLVGRPIRVRFQLSDADVFSLQFR
jgi:hypothetical protein